MGRFSISGAWVKGFGFLFRSGGMQARILIGVGVIAPLLLQLLVAAGTGGIGRAPTFAGPFGMGFALLVVALGSYLLRLGSYFASWWLGFHPGEDAGPAIGYGLITAMILVLAGGTLAGSPVLAGYAGDGARAAIAFLLGIPLLLLVDALFTTMVSAFMVGTIGLVLLVNLAPGFVARISPALAMTGGPRLTAIFLTLALLSWLAVRLSCTTAAMAAETRFNPLFGIALSWRMTAPAQWRIMAFLALVGLAMCLAFGALVLIFGARIGALLQPELPRIGSVIWIVGLIVAIPLPFLTVLVPAGIYRELRPFIPEEEIFS